jgi:limonene-1,2-epoxide hydrolase
VRDTIETTAGDRRTFLASAGMGAFVALIGTTSDAAVPALSAAEQANVKLVNDFCAAWATRDMTKILAFLGEDCVYRMTETTPSVTGHAGVTERIKPAVDRADAVTFEVLDTYARGPMVINHRIDRFASAERPFTWEGVGVFFVKDGKIREWFDYTIRMAR